MPSTNSSRLEKERLAARSFADSQHVGVDVDEGHAGQRTASIRHPRRDVAGAACDVDMRERAPQRRANLGDERVLPGPVQAERHQIVHHVIASGDLVEHVVHQGLLLFQRNGAAAEVRVIARGGHAGLSLRRPEP